jgi:hypothetical protein
VTGVTASLSVIRSYGVEVAAEVKRLPNNDATKHMHDRGEIDIYWVTPGYVLVRIKAAIETAEEEVVRK